MGHPAQDPDGLPQVFKGPQPARGPVAVRIPRRLIQDHQIPKITVAVGEAPGHPAVAAHRHGAGARQGEPGDPMLPPSCLWPDQRGPVPGVGHGDGQVHVVGQQGPAIRGPAPGQGPVVAAQDGRFRNRRPGGGGQVAPAQVEHLGSGNGRLDPGPSSQRRVPLGPLRDQERQQRGRQDIVHVAEPGRAETGILLELDEHRQQAEHRILRAPGHRFRQQRQVFEWPRPQGSEPGIDAGRVGLQAGPLVPAGLGDDLAGQVPEPVDPVVAIVLHHGRTQQLGQFPGGQPALEIHLEKPVLGMDEAQAAGHIDPVRRADHRRAPDVPGHGDRGGQSGQTDRAVPLRQAGGQLPAQPARANGRHQDQGPQ